jgi:hypothetical protein
MFKNSVVKASVDTKEWVKSTAVRAVKTFAETFVSMVTVGQAFNEVGWAHILSVSGVAALISVAVSIAGIPEVESQEIGTK